MSTSAWRDQLSGASNGCSDGEGKKDCAGTIGDIEWEGVRDDCDGTCIFRSWTWTKGTRFETGAPFDPETETGPFPVVVNAEGIELACVGWTRFLLLRFATSMLTRSPPPLMCPKPVVCDWTAEGGWIWEFDRVGDGGGVIWEEGSRAGTWWEYPSGIGAGTKPNFWRYCSCAECGAIPSSSSGSKLKTPRVPSEDAAYNVNPSQDLRKRWAWEYCLFGYETYQLKSIICLSNTSFATMRGRADFVCHTDTDLSSAPNATTEQIFDVATGAPGLRKNIWGL
jgi:hypothetical protein